jgi:signal transduction histidine kinase
VTGGLETVSPYAGLAAYRLVQEALSNVEHHARAADVVVRASNDGDHLAVSIRNGPSPVHGDRSGRDGPTGTGLSGMRQRLAILGGTLSAGPDGDGWMVEASIPLRRADAEARQ